MPTIIKPLFINTKSITGRPDAPTQTEHGDLTRWKRRYNTTDTTHYKGKEHTTLYSPRRDNPYHKQKEDVVNGVSDRVDAIILAIKPDYVSTPSTMHSEGDKITGYKCSLLLSVAFLCDAIADKKWRSREAAFYAINTHYLAIMRELYGQDTIYHNHKDIACTDHFIAEDDRFYGKRKKKQ